MLSDLNLKTGYSTGSADLIRDFYIPCLDQASSYDRAVGYFRSSLFILVGVAFSGFGRRGGKVRLVCSPQLASNDAEAFERGLSLRETITNLISQDIDRLLSDPEDRPVTEFLAALLAARTLEVRLALRPGATGIFHDKLGVFEDGHGDRVSFVGSANETFSAWDPQANHEGFEVFCSWHGEGDKARIARQVDYFATLWAGQEPGVTVMDFPEASRAKLLEISGTDTVDSAAERLRRVIVDRLASRRPQPPNTRKTLQQHQRTAVEHWLANGCRGILTHATGAGKTITATEIIRRWCSDNRPAIVLVPSQVLLRQWNSELLSELESLGPGILEVGAGHGRATWEGALADYTRPMPALGPRIVIATMQSASTTAFLGHVQAGPHLLVVADEVHRIGSPDTRAILSIEAGGRLGLSATPERYGDPIGTAAIATYFGSPLEPPFTIADAIAAGRLVPYDYFVHPVCLTPEEESEWATLTDEILKAFVRLPVDAGGTRAHSDYFKLLLIKRARIGKGAANKVPAAGAVLDREYSDGDRWLAYCDDREQLQLMLTECQRLGLPTYEYHSAMEGAPRETLESFQHHGGVIVAIKCLDEGIDLPLLNRAIILASSRNPREFIQRRGRVLRSTPGKYSAAIHDLLVVPSVSEAGRQGIGDSLLRSELARATQFANYSRNLATRLQLERLAAEWGIVDTDGRDHNFEDEEE